MTRTERIARAVLFVLVAGAAGVLFAQAVAVGFGRYCDSIGAGVPAEVAS